MAPEVAGPAVTPNLSPLIAEWLLKSGWLVRSLPTAGRLMYLRLNAWQLRLREHHGERSFPQVPTKRCRALRMRFWRNPLLIQRNAR